MYPCIKCSFVGTQNNALKKHISLNHKPDIFQCKLCPYVSATKKNTNLHVQRVHDVRKFICEICDKVYGDQSTLERHIRDVHQENRFKCDTCDNEFQTQHTLKEHRLTHQFCNICQKTISHLGNFNTHMKIHTGEKNFQCRLCNKIFTRAEVLKRHEIRKFNIFLQ